MQIFTYDELKKKAYRDINRLSESQNALDKLSSIDHALNAAFTIYHLVQWRNPEIKKVSDFVKKCSNDNIKRLHNVVIMHKHAEVRWKATTDKTDPRLENNITYLALEQGGSLLKENGSKIVTEDSKVEVWFGDYPAIDVLNGAMKEFESPQQPH